MLDALEIHRLAQAASRRGIPLVPRALRKLIQVTAAAYLGTEASFGPGCELAYGGLGIVVHPKSRIGARVLIGPHVTIGGRSGSRGAPTIEDDVKIGAGACLLGDIHVGCGANIGANAVVIHDVPAHATVAGVPARVIHAPAGDPAATPHPPRATAPREEPGARRIPIHFDDDGRAAGRRPKGPGRGGGPGSSGDRGLS